MKVISAKFLNEFYKLVEEYNPDKELNEIAELSRAALNNLTSEDKDRLNISASLLNVMSMGSVSPERRNQIIEFNCKAYSLIHDKTLDEVYQMDYKEVNEAVKKFRSENK